MAIKDLGDLEPGNDPLVDSFIARSSKTVSERTKNITKEREQEAERFKKMEAI